VQDAARQSASEAATKLEALERQTATLQGQEQESRSRREDLEKEMHQVRRQGDEAARAARTESDKCEALEKKQQAAELELSRVASELSAVREQLTRECAQRQEQERDLAHVPLRV
jgi:predicted  nucleic acid-binding Zn-ribbon protein